MSARDHGKKIGMITVPLKNPVRNRHSTELELRCDTRTGVFAVELEGRWYTDKDLEALRKKLSEAISLTAEIEWTRYIVVHYDARVRDVESFGQSWGSSEHWSPEHDRTKLAGVERADWARIKKKNPDAERWEEEPKVVVGISLCWSVVEYSAPFTPPGKDKPVRLSRHVDMRTLKASEIIEQERDDKLPEGAMLFSPQRLRYLESLRDALTNIDAKLAAMFAGDLVQIGTRVDAGRAFPTDPVLLLAAPPAEDDQ